MIPLAVSSLPSLLARGVQRLCSEENQEAVILFSDSFGLVLEFSAPTIEFGDCRTAGDPVLLHLKNPNPREDSGD